MRSRRALGKGHYSHWGPRLAAGVIAFALGLVSLPAVFSLGFGQLAHADTPVFHYGYDFSDQAPTMASLGPSASARQVMSSLPGTFDDTAIMGWGTPNPEPSPGLYDFSGIQAHLTLVAATGGTPMITLCAAPDWMKGGVASQTDMSKLAVAPLPQHYGDFAALAAKIAQAFPQVKYFVVWNEFKGFWNSSLNTWDAPDYTRLYNDVYTAVKTVRPDAIVGGPYAALSTLSSAGPRATQSTPTGRWGTVDQRTLDAVSYWLANKVGADFLAVDGSDVTSSNTVVGGPVVSTEKYAAIDTWLRARTTLPIFWSESHLEPVSSGWSDGEGSAVRVAALLQMASSGASGGMQWQPQDQATWPDIGLWTSALQSNGGQPTALAIDMQQVLPILEGGITSLTSPHKDVLVGRGPFGSIEVNGSSEPWLVVAGTQTVLLNPGSVAVQKR